MTNKRKTQGCGRPLALAAAVALLPSIAALAVEYDLTPSGTQSVNVDGEFGGVAVFSDFFEQPTGTGVFEPFLTLDSNGQTSTGNTSIESAYNTDGFTALYLDQHRPQWNERIRVSDLATVTRNGVNYFAFILDSNEPGGNKKTISIDNIRIYTSATDNTANVGNDITKLDQLGTLRWAMNNPLVTGTTPPDLNGFNVNQWVKLDSSQENVTQGSTQSNGGSGKGDMIVYIPQSDFGSSLGTSDFVWFYNLNGVHYSADTHLAAEAGFEEWRAVLGPQQVPDGGSTLVLLGSALTGLSLLASRRKLARNA